MKANKKQISAASFSGIKSAVKKSEFSLPFLAAMLMIFLIPLNAMASRERYVIDFDDSHIRGHKGQAATIFLKRSFKEQYPWVNLSNMNLRRVVLVAKSKRGGGGAQLRIGDRVTDMYGVAGSPQSFQNDRPYTFDRIGFRNPSYNSRGPWQINLKGNFIVRKVVLVVEDNSRRRHQSRRWGHHKW